MKKIVHRVERVRGPSPPVKAPGPGPRTCGSCALFMDKRVTLTRGGFTTSAGECMDPGSEMSLTPVASHDEGCGEHSQITASHREVSDE